MRTNTRQVTLAAMFLALAYLLPFVTGQFQQFGRMLCPMHIPVILCGFVCGWPWALAVGLTAPLLRSVTLGMPPLFPTGLCMALELGSYGFLSGWLYKRLPRTRINIYVALVTAMVGGRLIWGAARFLCTGLNASVFGVSAFWAGAVVTALPGIVLQLVAIPPLVLLLEKQGRTIQ